VEEGGRLLMWGEGRGILEGGGCRMKKKEEGDWGGGGGVRGRGGGGRQGGGETKMIGWGLWGGEYSFVGARGGLLDQFRGLGDPTRS